MPTFQKLTGCRYAFLARLLCAVAFAGCTGTAKHSSGTSSSTCNMPPSNPNVTVKVSPAGANVRAGAAALPSASNIGTSNTVVA